MVEVTGKIEIILLRSKSEKFFEFDAFLISKKCSPKFSVSRKTWSVVSHIAIRSAQIQHT
jgi:hypothetical protein